MQVWVLERDMVDVVPELSRNLTGKINFFFFDGHHSFRAQYGASPG
jgi:prepilin-type processing-associated H-X9-DG protein